jgi:hypothetical protein
MRRKEQRREERRQKRLLKKQEKLRKKQKLSKSKLKRGVKKDKITRTKRAATARPERLWDYGVIPYEIEANFSGEFYEHCIQILKSHIVGVCCVFVIIYIECFGIICFA